ncbi:hypothetical protein Pint_23962 [Pistacia integerrima]|uniref:Uncharacterized protein n=1 Tax=Pistacia integerrima TaxID=434235 RepID=A0ACC0YMP4_9ROSI|nr:hypothetical protein Pint_23962 [Pistacia integerrima]
MSSLSILCLILFFILLPHTILSKLEPVEALLNRLDSKLSSSSVQESAAKAVLQRLLPTHVHSFDFKIVSKDVCGGQSCFLIDNNKRSIQNDPEIMIRGTTGVEITSGLHWYIKYWCGAHVSWDKTGGIQIASVPSPGSLPLVKDEGVRIQRPVPWNYYQNVVTSSCKYYSHYMSNLATSDMETNMKNLVVRGSTLPLDSYVWWDWEKWEKEIDWMALQGINLPLAFTGQESIWQKVFMNFNISKEDLNDFFGGPSFLAWARMGNLHG